MAEVKWDTARNCPLLDPYGPIIWADKGALLGRMKDANNMLLLVYLPEEDEATEKVAIVCEFNFPIGTISPYSHHGGGNVFLIIPRGDRCRFAIVSFPEGLDGPPEVWRSPSGALVSMGADIKGGKPECMESEIISPDQRLVLVREDTDKMTLKVYELDRPPPENISSRMIN